MRKLIALLAVICVINVVHCQGPFGPPPPEDGSVADFLNQCLQVNYIPNDRQHELFMNQIAQHCGQSLPNPHVEPAHEAQQWLNDTQLCVSQIAGDEQLQQQILDTLTCVSNQVHANDQFDYSGFATKKATKKSHVQKKLNKSTRK